MFLYFFKNIITQRFRNYFIGFFIIALMMISLIIVSCKNSPEERFEYSADNYEFSYNLNNIKKKYKLPDELDEISGLSFYKKDKLACIQDEKAFIYIFDCEKEKIIEKYKFGKSGDYEGIEILGKDAFIIRSDGNLYFFEDFIKNKGFSVKIKTPLSERNNVEGLAFNKSSNSLLLACKASPKINKKQNLKNSRSVYGFDLSLNELSKNPEITINIDELRNKIPSDNYNDMSKDIIKKLNPQKGDPTFQPSAIAIHPFSKNIYIISSVGKLLIVLDHHDKKILSIKRLNPKHFRQPEGMCFNPEGDLFISNEAKKSKASILQFEYISE